MTAPLLRRTATGLRSRAEAVTADRWDSVGLWRLAAPDVLAEPWAGVLDDVADVVDEAKRLVKTKAQRPSPGWTAEGTAERYEDVSVAAGRSYGRSRPDSTTDEPRRAA